MEEPFVSDTNNASGLSRRTALLAAASAAPLLLLTSVEAQAKLAQNAVKYQATPNNGRQCDGCAQFLAPNSCKLVDGDIAPAGWCLLWVKKPA